MDRINQYREIVKQLLLSYAEIGSPDPDVETQMLFDTERDHYQLMNVGWKNQRRIYGCFLHIDIKDGKVWLQHNGTEDEVAEELIHLGIPKQDIVIGFHSPFKRQFTDYAVN
ncbi:fdxN element excision controlling factor protein [Tolypothrix tenuis PCC 7101]|uniref:FdxN element excision controlling factor protein n=1 Tax=Tolypothrix tenuis PCC 7101 TaxID=231146 RepID=A0A1Z4NAW7_9CYAN|nr:XisI protein [Aulosira sp. FACHB-113]MBD2342489.1 XisI protein [Calothrix sp. FACHB-156]BAZ02874.1 fdxN element excision controlling factor protein [Tolypothrix tenuis PCC 7101]BAZ78232.1 fdxN element excision controlling factor protein [Aulosira laxa NIES-50]